MDLHLPNDLIKHIYPLFFKSGGKLCLEFFALSKQFLQVGHR